MDALSVERQAWEVLAPAAQRGTNLWFGFLDQGLPCHTLLVSSKTESRSMSHPWLQTMHVRAPVSGNTYEMGFLPCELDFGMKLRREDRRLAASDLRFGGGDCTRPNGVVLMAVRPAPASVRTPVHRPGARHSLSSGARLSQLIVDCLHASRRRRWVRR